jgi:hypothetical protein
MPSLREALLARLVAIDPSGRLARQIQADTAPFGFGGIDLAVAMLVEAGAMTTAEYIAVRRAHAEAAPNLHLYQITAPRTFGETWAQKHVADLVPDLRPSSREVDAGYLGQYDLIHQATRLRIEVKATRVVRAGVAGRLPDKALSARDSSDFTLYFKQIKPDCCDAFVLVVVWLDDIGYWVVPAAEMPHVPSFTSKLHRKGEGSGQLQIRKSVLPAVEKYRVPQDELAGRLARLSVA